MKKNIMILMALAIVLTLSSCGLKNSDGTGNPGNNEYKDDLEGSSDSRLGDQEDAQGDSNQYSSFYTQKFEQGFTSVYDDPDGKITFQYPKEMDQTDGSLTCMNPFLTISVDHGVRNYGESLEDAKAVLESICDETQSTTIGGKEAVMGFYDGEQTAGGEYVVFVGGESHKFMTISFAVMPGYAQEYSAVVDSILSSLEFLS